MIPRTEHEKGTRAKRISRREELADEASIIVCIYLGAALSRVVAKVFSGHRPTLGDFIFDPWKILAGGSSGVAAYFLRFGLFKAGEKPPWIGRAFLALFIGAGGRGMIDLG